MILPCMRLTKSHFFCNSYVGLLTHIAVWVLSELGWSVLFNIFPARRGMLSQLDNEHALHEWSKFLVFPATEGTITTCLPLLFTLVQRSTTQQKSCPRFLLSVTWSTTLPILVENCTINISDGELLFFHWFLF